MKFNFLSKFIAFITRWFSRWQIKLILGTAAFAIVVIIILFTQSIVSKLIEREQDILMLYRDTFENYIMPYEAGLTSAEEEFSEMIMLFIIENIQPRISFPVIMTDPQDQPIPLYENWTLNIKFDEGMSDEEQKEYLLDFIERMRANYEPFLIRNRDGEVVQKLFYTHSEIVDILRYFPILAVIVISTFVFIGYIAFSTSRKNEQHKVWVGMAKEAAHQLGTPLSSLMAWLEIITYSKDDPKQIEETLTEMKKDVSRLNIIATRFSKIGSEPEMQHVNLGKQIENVISYFERRLPHLGKKIEVQRNFNGEYKADINPELFNWVFENLLKNAAEAIEEKHGIISISMEKESTGKIMIEVKDNGKGISKRVRNQIFYPGYTTKKRGWGLGLSLTKRIIEEYHKGRIYVKDSQPGIGTTFAIELKENLYN